MDKILANIDAAVKDGLAKARTVTVSTELSDLEDKIGETIEWLTKQVTNGELDLPVSVMLFLMDSSNAITRAKKEFEAYKKEAGNVTNS